jgi:hypothetical protein
MYATILGHVLFYVIPIASGLSENPGMPALDVIGRSLLYGVIASIIFYSQAKKRPLFKAWLIAMFFPIYAIYYIFFGRSKGGQGSEVDGRPKVGAFMRAYTGTDKKVICQNCGCRLKKEMMGGWSPITADSHCARERKKCVPQESLL